MPEFSLLLCLQIYFFFPLNCVSFLGRFLKRFEGLLHYNSLNEISILAVNKMLSSLLLEAYPWLWVDVALPPAQKHFLRACRLLKLPHFLAQHGRPLHSLCWGDGIKAQPHQMGRCSADSYLGRQQGPAGEGGGARSSDLRCPTGSHCSDARGQTPSTRPARQPHAPSWFYLGLHLTPSVAWLSPHAHGAASHPGDEDVWEAPAHGVRQTPANGIHGSQQDDQALPKIAGRKCWGEGVDLAWNLFMSSALELDQPFLA